MNAGLVISRASNVLRPDPSRVIARLFVPGHELLVHGVSRAAPVIDRILAIPAEVAAEAVLGLMERYGHRHADYAGLLVENFAMVAHRVGAASDLPEMTRLLIGAYFTHEYSIEAAALFNPSIVTHPDQTGLRDGEIRVLLSLRAVGEGHLSSIEFRTGVADVDGQVRLDEPASHLVVGRVHESTFDRDLFRSALIELGDDGEDAAFVLDSLPETFTSSDLRNAFVGLRNQQLTRPSADRTIERLRWVASCNYEVRFPEASQISARVLMPNAPTETHGMEDARFVRFTDDDGSTTYLATYTAFDGSRVVPQMLTTSDFTTFRSSQLIGQAAANKGMALFPRRINGRFVALSRWDRENNSIAMSDDGRAWGEPSIVATPRQPWELIQIGNCGSPIETPDGWIVLTHGVGPMRSYGIGAMLLDLDDPRQQIASLPEPLLTPADDERDGYVPNVVYTCGALPHGDRLIVPYGCSDSAIGIAVIDLPELRKRLVSQPRSD